MSLANVNVAQQSVFSLVLGGLTFELETINRVALGTFLFLHRRKLIGHDTSYRVDLRRPTKVMTPIPNHPSTTVYNDVSTITFVSKRIGLSVWVPGRPEPIWLDDNAVSLVELVLLECPASVEPQLWPKPVAYTPIYSWANKAVAYLTAVEGVHLTYDGTYCKYRKVKSFDKETGEPRYEETEYMDLEIYTHESHQHTWHSKCYYGSWRKHGDTTVRLYGAGEGEPMCKVDE